MGQSTFKGGAHPYEGKELTMDYPIAKLEPGQELVFPMSQHIGAPATPIVSVGDTVKIGQTLGEAGGFVSANVTSSVSGEVVAVEPRVLSSGARETCVVIANDGEDEAVEGFGTERDYTTLSKEEIRDIIKDAGIVGMGGAGFPTHVKLSPKNEEDIDYVIINGAECEPYLTSDYRAMIERAEDLITGLKVILSLFDNAKGIIAIENNKSEAIAKLQYLTEDDADISVKSLKTKYPQGAERQVIYVATKRKINSRMLPADVGCIVDNVQTVLAVYDAVCRRKPCISRIMTLTGDAMKQPANYEVRLGMSHAEVIEKAGGLHDEAEKIISGGPMMGMAMYDLNTPVIKTSSSILALSVDEAALQEPTNCIHCGRCANVCPSRLVPQMMVQAIKRNDLEKFEKLNGMECYECGTCTYVCPAKIRLTQKFKQARREIMDKRKK